MLCVIQVIKDFKEYYSINDTVELKVGFPLLIKKLEIGTIRFRFMKMLAKKQKRSAILRLKMMNNIIRQKNF